MKILKLFCLVFCLVLWQSCSTKQNEEAAADAESEESMAEEGTEMDENASETDGAMDAAVEGADAAASANTYVSASGRTVYLMAEVQPTFEGGEESMKKFLMRNLKYPDTDAEGTVNVGFVVAEDGSVGDVAVENGVEDEALRAEAIRVVSKMPNWMPGQQGGAPVHVKYVLPVTFKKQ